MIKALVFDWGGVLTHAHFGKTFRKNIEKEYGISQEEMKNTYDKIGLDYETGNCDADTFFQKYSTLLDNKISPGELRRIFLSSFAHNRDMFKILRQLKKHFPLYLLSDNFKELKTVIEKDQDYHDIFTKTYYSCDHEATKRDLHFFKKFMSETGFLPEEILFIDDQESNLRRAKSLGWNIIHFKDIPSFKENLAQCIGKDLIGSKA